MSKITMRTNSRSIFICPAENQKRVGFSEEIFLVKFVGTELKSDYILISCKPQNNQSTADDFYVRKIEKFTTKRKKYTKRLRNCRNLN